MKNTLKTISHYLKWSLYKLQDREYQDAYLISDLWTFIEWLFF